MRIWMDNNIIQILKYLTQFSNNIDIILNNLDGSDINQISSYNANTLKNK